MQKISTVSTLLRLKLARRMVDAHSRWLGDAGLPSIACFPRDWIGRAIVGDGLHERELLEALELTLLTREPAWRDAVALDVGANIGNHTLFFSRFFARIISFEPNPLTVHLLHANVMANGVSNVTIIEAGLSDSNGNLPFVMSEGNLGEARIVAPGTAASAGTIPLRIGDEVVAEQEIGEKRVAFIKIDVEGHELPALRGLAGTLSRYQPVVAFESNFAHGDGGGAVVVDYLKSCGYTDFYTLEARTLFPQFMRIGVVKFFEKLLIGHSKELRPLANLADRFYPFVLASMRPLALTRA